MRFPQVIAGTLLALMYALAPAHAQKRVALVVGNDRYPNLPAHEQLQKATSDALAVGGALARLQFEVMSGENAGRQELVDKLDAFTRRLTSGDTAFFFFSGHGVALGGVNYILPSDIPNIGDNQESRLTHTALSEQEIVADLKSRGVRVAVVVLDACRTNPFSWAGGKGVGGEKGLAAPPQVKGVFSLYAASSGQAARDRLSDDDRNPNSVFSRVLVPSLARPGIDLATLAIEVREEVARIAATAGYEQQPAYYDETTGGRVYLNGAPRGGGQAGAPAVTDAERAERTWPLVKDVTTLAVLDDFIARFGNVPIYGALALARRDQLAKQQAKEPAKPAEGQQVAMVVAPPATPAVPAADPCSGRVAVSFASRCGAPLTAAQERALKPKETFRECPDCPEMVAVPPGSFTMGSPAGETGRDSDEGPQHAVTIRQPFAVGKLHVTVDQFSAFVRETRYEASSKCTTFEGGKSEERSGRSWRNPGFVQEGSHPVVCVTWNDANAYVDWLAKKTGKPHRLLSEAEYEYAARGRTSPGTYPRFWFGDDEKDFCRNGNGGDQKTKDSVQGVTWTTLLCNDGYAYTSPAGRYSPNAFGLYDMAGNAWQWTADCWHGDYKGAPADGTAWTTGGCSIGHVIRGGAWINYPRHLRAAHRNWDTDSNNSVGFRVARTITP